MIIIIIMDELWMTIMIILDELWMIIMIIMNKLWMIMNDYNDLWMMIIDSTMWVTQYHLHHPPVITIFIAGTISKWVAYGIVLHTL